MKKFRLYHYHKNMWWEAGERTEDQIKALEEVADWFICKEGATYFYITKMWKDEPHWKVEEIQ